MPPEATLLDLPADSFLEYAFVRWVLAPAVNPAMRPRVWPQHEVTIGERTYRLDYALQGQERSIAIELDGFAYHGDRSVFNYDRMRQNDLQGAGWSVLRFTYDAIRSQTARCVAQLQALLATDPALQAFLVPHPCIEEPHMDPDPLYGLTEVSKEKVMMLIEHYFATVRTKLNLKTLRDCQTQAFAALSNYYGSGDRNAACVMSVGAGKTALGVVAALAFSQRRALIVTPGSVIRGTFDKALDHHAVGNVLYGLPGGPLIPGCRPPQVRTLDREEGPIRGIGRQELLTADIIVTNFHTLGTGKDEDDLLAKLAPEDIDYIVVDEAHIAASDSYQRLFAHFATTRRLLMSACFQRLDGKPIDADVVYRYRLIDSIADGNAKNLRVHRFAPRAEETIYEMVWPDGRREEIVGRDALLGIIDDERKLSRIVAKSDASIRQIMRAAKVALDRQAELLYPIKPRVLFSALGERHAEQIARIAEDYGIPCDYLHHSMSDAKIKAKRGRYEQDAGDLQGIVQLKMLGQGYDFPPICVVVPMRPYGSFSEFYQFVGRGIRILLHPALTGRVGPGEQYLDIIYHAELGLDDHIETIYRENDMDPPSTLEGLASDEQERADSAGEEDWPSSAGAEEMGRPDAFVLVDRGRILQRVVHDAERVEQARAQREQEALAQRYAAYAQTTEHPVPFDEFAKIIKMMST